MHAICYTDLAFGSSSTIQFWDMNLVEDLRKKRFNRLTVKKLAPERMKRAALWICHCDCGQVVRIRADVLKSGASGSCGCIRRERFMTHGLSKEHRVAYGKWADMIQRCTNPRRSTWKWYGGRGIEVCKRWLHFKNFYNDMGDPPEGLTLERENNELGYSLGNCKWATPKEQANNRRPRRVAATT